MRYPRIQVIHHLPKSRNAPEDLRGYGAKNTLPLTLLVEACQPDIGW